MPEDDHAPLSSAEISYLLTVAAAVDLAPDAAAAREARTNAAREAARYRARGHAWADIAVVYRITEVELRHWRALAEPKPQPPARRPAGRPATVEASPAFCFLAGNTSPRGNRFDREAGMFRGYIEAMALSFRYEPSVEIDRVTVLLRERRPTILHLAAHAERSVIYLSRHGEAMPITFTTVRKAIRAASFVPLLTVLNLCDGYDLACQLHGDGHTVIGWPATVDDNRCALFATHLYQALAAGRRLGAAFAAAEMMVVAANPRIVPPILLGGNLPRLVGALRSPPPTDPHHPA